jgi:hypothetical protein
VTYAVLLGCDGRVTKGRGWNTIAFNNGRRVSPDGGVLEGITRRMVVELSDPLDIDSRISKLPSGLYFNHREVKNPGDERETPAVAEAVCVPNIPMPFTAPLEELVEE